MTKVAPDEHRESEVKARRTVAAAVRENEKELDQTELIKLLEEEMIEAARNLEFERAAQLRDKLNQYKGAPTISSGGGAPTRQRRRRRRGRRAEDLGAEEQGPRQGA